VRRLYAKGLMSELIEKTINETSQQVLNDNQLRVAAPPELKPVSDMEQVLNGKVDLAYDIDVEVMPDFEPMDVSTLTLTRPVYKAEAAEVDEALAEIVSSNKTYEARGGKAPKAQDGDQLLIDFLGKIDGQRDVPRRLRRGKSGRQGRRVRRKGQGSARAQSRGPRRRLGRANRLSRSRGPDGRGARQRRAAI
jgi:FKBP-type peptidyl-prolyl cis-trans isomerase (trigger factor)